MKILDGSEHEIKVGDALLIDDGRKVFAATAKEVVDNGAGSEIIFKKKKNKYFNLDMFLKGRSWVKDLKIVRHDRESA